MQNLKNDIIDLLQSDNFLKAALLVGKIQNPNFNTAPFEEKILHLASKVWNQSARAKKDPIFKADIINKVLFNDFEMVGKSDKVKQIIDDPNRFYLHSVIENKVSSSLSLTILYAILANQVGIPFECLALPSTYLLKISDIDFDFYIEPFDGGKFLTEEEFQKKFKTSVQKNKMLSTKLFEKTNLAQLVSKLVQQLKHIYIIKGNAAVALRAVEILTALYPNSPEHTRDRGILYCEMEYFSKAVEDLKYYLERRPQAEDFSEIKKLANMIKSYREVMN